MSKKKKASKKSANQKNINQNTKNKRTEASKNAAAAYMPAAAPDPRILQGFLLIAPFLWGGFYEAVSCVFTIFLAGYLLYSVRRTGGLTLRVNLTLISVLVLTLMYGVSAVWAVDHGMAVFGFVKFLPLPLFALVLMQEKAEERVKLLDMVPVSGCLMTVLSFALSRIPALEKYFLVNGRLAGFFQYPNAFALFLIAGVVILAGKDTWSKVQIPGCVILLFGVALTGSRTAFAVLLIVMLGMVIFHKNRRIQGALLLLLAVMVAVTALYAVLTGNVSNVGRYLTSSLHASTFLGRLLYFKDALPVIIRHPFGLGYMGYYYLQGSFQTGVYSVMNIHNEFLQVLLDVGWVPALLTAAAVVKSFMKKETGLTSRMLLFAICAHSMFDFDLQFIVIGFVLLLAMDLETGRVWKSGGKIWVQIVAGILIIVNCWLGIASGLYRTGNLKAASAVYPGCTGAWLGMLSQAEDTEEMEELADKILFWNQSVSLAYSAKARLAYAEGDFEAMIEDKRQAIALARYELEEYLDYFDMLYTGIRLYAEAGDENSALYCRQKLLEIPDMLKEVLEGTDKLAFRIHDKPELELPEEYKEVLESLESR